MNTLLPKSEQEFSEVNYWERFFKNRSKSFDWYGDYATLSELFQKYVKLKDDILIVGCGNSTLSIDLYTIQKCQRICSIDISTTAIDQMKLKHKKIICPITDKNNRAFDYKCVDVCSFSEDEDIKKLLPVSCIVDKGTTDAIHSGGEASESVIINMWKEIDANLAVMGRYVLITLAQSHIVDSIIGYFLKENGSDIVNDKQARFKLCKDHLKSRVCLFVYLNPREIYVSKQMIQNELNSVAVNFCPADVPENYSIPYVSCHDLIYNSKTENYGDIFMEYLETPNESYSRLIAPYSDCSVIVSDKSISLRDKLITEFIELLQTNSSTDSGLYCGQACCTTSLSKQQWKLYLNGCESTISNVINSKFQINCIHSNDLFGEFHWLVYNSSVLDKGLMNKLMEHLSARGLVIVCCDNCVDFQELAMELSLNVIFSCTTIEKFGGDKSNFSIMSKTPGDARLWKGSYEKLCVN